MNPCAIRIDHEREAFSARLLQAALSVKLAHHEFVASGNAPDLAPLVNLLESELQRLINNETQCFDNIENMPKIAQLILLMFADTTPLPRELL